VSTPPLRVLVVVGSVRDGRFGPTVANWFTRQAEQHSGLRIDHLDLAEHPLPLRLTQTPAADTAASLAALAERLANADALVLVTPEYNHSYPASLKNLIDWTCEHWRAKPVAFVSYGGLAGGLRAVEALRVVLGELHTATLRDVVSFHNAWAQFDQDGELEQPQGATGAAKTLLDRLAWWGHALRAARELQPY
jgi:NAD(P)H-dependent FMN reductase